MYLTQRVWCIVMNGNRSAFSQSKRVPCASELVFEEYRSTSTGQAVLAGDSLMNHDTRLRPSCVVSEVRLHLEEPWYGTKDPQMRSKQLGFGKKSVGDIAYSIFIPNNQI